MDYLKYYLLEDYLLKEVKDNFEKNGFLTPEEFFCIVIWKANRAKTTIKRRLLKTCPNLKTAIKKLTSEIYSEPSKEKKLRILLDKWKFQLPMASAILTILYPDDFTIYDVRVRNQLKISDFCGRKNQIKKYFNEYLPKVKKCFPGMKLRDKDKNLWGKSFYEDLVNFLKI